MEMNILLLTKIQDTLKSEMNTREDQVNDLENRNKVFFKNNSRKQKYESKKTLRDKEVESENTNICVSCRR